MPFVLEIQEGPMLDCVPAFLSTTEMPSNLVGQNVPSTETVIPPSIAKTTNASTLVLVIVGSMQSAMPFDMVQIAIAWKVTLAMPGTDVCQFRLSKRSETLAMMLDADQTATLKSLVTGVSASVLTISLDFRPIVDLDAVSTLIVTRTKPAFKTKSVEIHALELVESMLNVGCPLTTPSARVHLAIRALLILSSDAREVSVCKSRKLEVFLFFFIFSPSNDTCAS